MITVIINGTRSELAEATSVQNYLEQKGLAGRSLAVAVNGEVIKKAEYATTLLGDGDQLEIVRPVGGGR
jgi:thiamine biosynthesis protein ThiS